jgi:zinc transport system permease protein
MLAIFQYGFITRGIIAGVIIGGLAPLIGIFLVLRKYSLIADTLAHVSLAGVALGLLLRIPPLVTGIAAATVSSIAVERLRLSQRVYADSALSIFLSGSLALAIVLISVAHGFSVDLFNYLFGSLVTVKSADVYLICALGVLVLAAIIFFYKELLYISFDEDSAQVAGIPTRFINTLLIVLAALTVSISIPIVGTLLIAALIVIPVVTALQLRKSFLVTIIYAEIISVLSVLAGIIGSFYLDIPAGGAIVLLTIVIFTLVFLSTKRSA